MAGVRPRPRPDLAERERRPQAPGEAAAERATYANVVLVEQVRAALARLARTYLAWRGLAAVHPWRFADGIDVEADLVETGMIENIPAIKDERRFGH